MPSGVKRGRTYPNQFAKYIGAASGATLGYISNNVAGFLGGGAAGWAAGQNYSGYSEEFENTFSPSDMKPHQYGSHGTFTGTKRKAIDEGSGPKVTKQRTIGSGFRGRAKRYSRVRYRPVRTKMVRRKIKGRVRKVLKSFVKDVVKCGENVGTYKKMYTGEISAYAGDNSGRVSNNHRVWFCGFNKLQGNTSPYTAEACRFTPNSKKRGLDAASVLYNAKAAAVNYELSTDNFDTLTTKVEFYYSSYHLKIKNVTLLDYDYEIFEVHNKINSQLNFIDTAQEVITTALFNFASTGATFTFASVDSKENRYVTPILFDLTDIKGLDKLYSWKRVKHGSFLAGKEINYFHKLKDYCVEYSKFDSIPTISAAPVPAFAQYAKGDIQLIISMKPKLHAEFGATDSTAAVASHTSDRRYNFPITVVEHWKVMQPRNTAIDKCGNKLVLLQANTGATSPSDITTVAHNGFFTRQSSTVL